MGSHSKRMKKRRELDALISGNRSKRGYEQLQPHLSQPDVVFSSSSRDGECIQPQLQGYGTRKRMGRSVSVRKRGCCIKQMYHLCLPACMVAMITMCVAISIGIVWLQLHLKSEVETLKSRLARLERLERDEPASMADLHTSMSAVQHEVANIKQRIRPMQGQLASLQQQFEQQSTRKLVQKAQDEINQNMREMSSEITNMENSITELQSATQQLTSESSRTNDDVTQLNHLLTQYKQETSEQKKPQRYAMTTSHEDFYNSSIGAIQLRLKMVEEQLTTTASTSMLQPISDQQLSILVDVSSLKDTFSDMNASIFTLIEGDHRMQTRMSILEQSVGNPRELRPRAHPPETPSSSVNGEQSDKSSSDASDGRSSLEVAVSPSHQSDQRVGDTTTSFTEQPAKEEAIPLFRDDSSKEEPSAPSTPDLEQKTEA